MIEQIISAIWRAEKGKMNVPLELRRMDYLGNRNGHIDLEDGKIILGKVLEDISSIADTASNIVSNATEGLSHIVSSIGDTLSSMADADFIGNIIDIF